MAPGEEQAKIGLDTERTRLATAKVALVTAVIAVPLTVLATWRLIPPSQKAPEHPASASVRPATILDRSTFLSAGVAFLYDTADQVAAWNEIYSHFPRTPLIDELKKSRRAEALLVLSPQRSSIEGGTWVFVGFGSYREVIKQDGHDVPVDWAVTLKSDPMTEKKILAGEGLTFKLTQKGLGKDVEFKLTMPLGDGGVTPPTVSVFYEMADRREVEIARAKLQDAPEYAPSPR